MQGRARYIFAALQSGMMAVLMTAIITALNLGFPPDFMLRWGRGVLLAWPCAFFATMVARPLAQRGTDAILAWLAGRRA